MASLSKAIATRARGHDNNGQEALGIRLEQQDILREDIFGNPEIWITISLVITIRDIRDIKDLCYTHKWVHPKM